MTLEPGHFAIRFSKWSLSKDLLPSAETLTFSHSGGQKIKAVLTFEFDASMVVPLGEPAVELGTEYEASYIFQLDRDCFYSEEQIAMFVKSNDSAKFLINIAGIGEKGNYGPAMIPEKKEYL